MALLETLPEEVENSLLELRANAGKEETKVLEQKLIENDDTPKNGNHAPTSTAVESQEEIAVREAEVVKKELIAADAIKRFERPIVFATDVTDGGTFGEEWLVVDDKRVYVFSRNGGNKAKVRYNIPIDSIKEAKADTHIGNGQIEIRTNDETIGLVRYSQATVREANTVARQISALANGDPPKEEKVEAIKKLCPKCKRVLPEDSDVCPGCVNKRAVMLRLFKFMSPYKALAVWNIVVMLFATGCGLVAPRVGGQIIDILSKGGPGAYNKLLVNVGIIAGAAVGSALCQYFGRRINAFLGTRISMDIRLAVYDKFTQLSLGYYDKRSIGTVMSRITNDADQLWDFLTEGVPWFIMNIASLFGIGYMLFRMNWQLALLMLIPGPFIYLLNKWFMPRARKRWQHVWHRISKMYSSLNSSLNGMRVVKAFNQEARETTRFGDRNQQVFDASYAANAMWATYFPLLGLLVGVGSYIVYIYGGRLTLVGVMTVGTLTAFNAYLVQFYGPFQNFSRVMDWTTRSLTAAERVFEILDTVPDIQESKHAVSMPEMRGKVEFEDVSFTYDNAKRVLENFTLKVEAGEMIGTRPADRPR